MSKYFIYRAKHIAMARLHTEDCFHARRRVQRHRSGYGEWLGPFATQDDALKAMRRLGLKNSGSCIHCSRDKYAAHAS